MGLQHFIADSIIGSLASFIVLIAVYLKDPFRGLNLQGKVDPAIHKIRVFLTDKISDQSLSLDTCLQGC